MRYLLSVYISLFAILATFSQEKYYTKTGTIYFMSHTTAIDIDGTNRQVASFFNIETGEIVFAVLIKSFEFTLATALEHFNETYMESHKYPKASFKGAINNYNRIDPDKPGTYDVTVTGQLTIKGITREITEKATLTLTAGKINAASQIKINISDYGIEVPKVVEDRVAKTVDVKINLTYEPFKK